MTINSERSVTSDLLSFSDDPCLKPSLSGIFACYHLLTSTTSYYQLLACYNLLTSTSAFFVKNLRGKFRILETSQPFKSVKRLLIYLLITIFSYYLFLIIIIIRKYHMIKYLSIFFISLFLIIYYYYNTSRFSQRDLHRYIATLNSTAQETC